MYESSFGLRERPFRPTPDSATYYPATTHEAALARLCQGIQDGEGVLLLTGGPGTGKTLLCHRLIERLGPDLLTAFLANSRCDTPAGLFQAILFELSLPYEGRSPQELRLAVTDCILKNYAAGKRAVLVIDEAQHLTAEMLEEVRLLGNLESRSGKAVQVVLVGQPRLIDTLQKPELAVLRQRLAVRCSVEPLGPEEATDFLLHQLRTAGGRPEAVITGEALEVIVNGCGGAPRVLCQAAHEAFRLAHHAGARQVDAEAALEALAALGLGAEEEPVEEGAAEIGLEEAAFPGPALRRA